MVLGFLVEDLLSVALFDTPGLVYVVYVRYVAHIIELSYVDR